MIGKTTITLQVMLAVIIVFSWETLANMGFINPLFLSSPSHIFGTIVTMFSQENFAYDVLVTIVASLSGFFLGSIFAIGMGFALGLNKQIREVIEPYIYAFYYTPRLAFIPLTILYFGIGLVTNLVTSALFLFFPVLVNTIAGVIYVDPLLIEAAESFGATRRQVILRVIIPASFETIFPALRVGLAFSLVGTVVSEMFAARAGIGLVIQYAFGTLQTSKLFAALLVLAIVGVIFNSVAKKIEDTLLFWKTKKEKPYMK